MAVHKCFVCTGQIQSRTVGQNFEANSLLLCQILEIPQLVNNEGIRYCPDCTDKILNIGDMLEDLERLEKKVLDEKYLIEVQLKENSKTRSDSLNSSESDKLRLGVASELRLMSIESMLKKIRKKQVGRKSRGQKLRILKGIPIPRIVTPTEDGNDPSLILAQSLNEKKSPIGQLRDSPNCQRLSLENSEVKKTELSSRSGGIKESLNITLPSTSWTSSAYIEGCDIKYFNETQAVCPDLPAPYASGVPFFTTVSEFSSFENTSHPTKYEVVNEVEEAEIFQGVEGSDTYQNFVCGTCGENFQDYEQLKIHDRFHHNRTSTHKRFPDNPSRRAKKCEECGKVLSNPTAWKHHVMTIHRRQHHFTCSICNRGFQRLSDLKYHWVTHTKEKNFKCSSCDKCFKYKRNLDAHMKGHLPIIEIGVKSSKSKKLQKCEECGRILANRQSLRNHIKAVHRNDHKHRCTICNAGCQSNSDLQNHMLIHSDVRNFKCESCPSAFKQKKNLTAHLRKNQCWRIV